MIDKVKDTIDYWCMISPGENILVALSGGADSVCLLNVLQKLRECYKINIYAVHINHCLRGEDSILDEDFVRNLCLSENVELFVETIDVNKLSKQKKESQELCGRQVRYEAFNKLAKKLKAKIATAHTASDNAETLLLNITRGSGLKGLCGIPFIRGNIIRPLLNVTRAEIEQYCKENQLDYVTDKTNSNLKYTRNKIRHQVIPVLKTMNARFEETALRLNYQLSLVNGFVEEYTENALAACRIALSKKENLCGYKCEKLQTLHPAILRSAVKMIFNKAGGFSIEEKHINLCCQIIQSGGAVNLTGPFTATSKNGIFIITNEQSWIN